MLARTAARPGCGPSCSRMIGALLLVADLDVPERRASSLALIPTAGTFEHFGALLERRRPSDDPRRTAVPVPDLDGLLLRHRRSASARCAILVDLVAVGPAPAGAGRPADARHLLGAGRGATPTASPVLPFVVGAAGFLWLLVTDNVDRVRRFGRRFTGDGRDVDVWEPSPLAAAGRRLGRGRRGRRGAAAAGRARHDHRPARPVRHRSAGDGAGLGAGTGGTGRVNLFAALQRAAATRPRRTDMVRVTTNDPDPFYLRFGVADQVTDDGLRQPRAAAGSRVSDGLPTRRSSPAPGVTYRAVPRRRSRSPTFDMPLAPIYRPADRASTASTTPGSTTRTCRWSTPTGSTAKGKKYAFDYVRADYTPAGAAHRAGRWPPTAAAGAQLHQRAGRAAGRRPGRRADRGQEHPVRQGAWRSTTTSPRRTGSRYSAAAPSGGTSGQDIVDFLDNKQGFCQQYAAAMAWMVRAAGIPARVAFGFTRGSSRDGDTLHADQPQPARLDRGLLHGFGWVPFDATPASGVPGSTRPAWAPDPDAPEHPAVERRPSAGARRVGQPGGAGRTRTARPASTERRRRRRHARRPVGPTWPLYLLGAA